MGGTGGEGGDGGIVNLENSASIKTSVRMCGYICSISCGGGETSLAAPVESNPTTSAGSWK